MKHPLIVGLLAALPEPGEPFDPAEKDTWIKTLEMNLAVIYKTPKAMPRPQALIEGGDAHAQRASQSDAG